MPYLKNSYYTIYMYQAPDGRVYIGKTRLQKGARAGAQGVHYRNCTRFWDAIQKYGWESFTYTILATVPIEETNRACDLEAAFIKKYQSVDPRFGFNIERTDKPRDYTKLASSRLNRRIMHKDGVVRQVPGPQFQEFLSQGWVPGYIHTS